MTVRAPSLRIEAVIAIALAAVLGLSVHAQAMQAKAVAKATTTVFGPLKITAAAQMSFGKLHNNGNGPATTPVILPSQPGVARSSPNAQLLPNGNETPAIRTVTGEAGRVYRVTLPASTVSAPQNYVINAFTVWSTNRGNISTARLGQLDASGRDTIRVGATMTVPKGAKNDTYTANPTILISYE